MRELLPTPSSVLDPATGRPRVGSYRGGLPIVDVLGARPSLAARAFRRKRWIYVGIVTADVYIGVAVVRLGYAANAFAYLYDARARKMLADRSAIAPHFRASVDDEAGAGRSARFTSGKSRIVFERRGGVDALDVRMPGLEITATLDATSAPPAVGAIADLGGGSVDATEKRALLAVSGDVRVGDQRVSLDGALGFYDYTHGLLPRETRWRWAFMLGRAKGGERVAVNLVEGFTGEVECAAWVDDEAYPLAEGRFTLDAAKPLDPWRIGTSDGAVDFTLAPGAMHADRTNLGIVRSQFVQPAGVYTGTLRIPGRGELVLDRALGVAEDQHVVW
jgi:Protein of unknown function (DUF2804)